MVSRRVCGSKKSACSLKSQKREFLHADPQAQKATRLTGRMIALFLAEVCGRNMIMEVVEDFESRLHRSVTFLVEREGDSGRA